MKKKVIYYYAQIFCLIIGLFFSCKKDDDTPTPPTVKRRVLSTADLFFSKTVVTPTYNDCGRLLLTTIATVTGTYLRHFTYKGNIISVVADNNDPLHHDSLTVTLNNLGLISSIEIRLD